MPSQDGGAPIDAVDRQLTDIPALEATVSASDRIRGVARTRTTVVLSTRWEGRHG